MKIDLTDRERQWLLHHIEDDLSQEKELGGEGKAAKEWLAFLETLRSKLRG